LVWKFNDEQPIYQQIISQIKERIVAGEWKAGDKLKSVRELALEAGVNPNTMQKALAELEREGLEVLGEKVLHVQLSVAPGRDIARLVEVAAMDYHLKDMGIDMAGEFNRRLMSNFPAPESDD